MGRLTDLDQFDDTPRDRLDGATVALDPGTTALLARIADLLDRAAWAASTLTGIRDTIRYTGRVSEAQLRAVNNIEAAAERGEPDRPYRARSGSRWEGPPPVKPGHCRRCRRLLTDAESIRLGIGPECREKEANGE